MQQDKTAADAAFATAMHRRDEAFTRFWRCAKLPLEPSMLQLSEAAVHAAGAVDPKEVMREVQQQRHKEVLSPTQVFEFSDNTAAPHYLAQTAVNHNRAAMRAHLIEQAKESMAASPLLSWSKLDAKEAQARIRASKRRQKLHSQSMPGDQWDAERHVIARMQHKLSFRRNPRFAAISASPPPPAIADPMLARPRFSLSQSRPAPGALSASLERRSRAKTQQERSFVCEPAEALFTDWQPGQAYDVQLQVCTCLCMSCTHASGKVILQHGVRIICAPLQTDPSGVLVLVLALALGWRWR